MGFFNRARMIVASVASLASALLGRPRHERKRPGIQAPGSTLGREKPRGGLVQGAPKFRRGWGPHRVNPPGTKAGRRMARRTGRTHRWRTLFQAGSVWRRNVANGIARRLRAGADKSLRQEIKRMLGSPRKARRAMLAERRDMAALIQAGE